MKFQLKNIAAIVLIAISLFSCSNDDEVISGNGNLKLEFDNTYGMANFAFNTEYTVMYDNWNRGKIRKEYIIVKDMDFHVMNKENFLELVS